MPLAGTRLPATPLRLALLLAFGLLVLRVAWLSDDAYISFRTVWNWAHGYGLTWNTDERVQAYTHPLWLFAVTALHVLTDEIYLTAISLSVLLSLAAVAVVLFRVSRGPVAAIGFVALLAASQSVLDYTTSGLENPLSYLLVALFAVLWLPSRPGQRPLFRLFLTGGLLALNRLDLALLVAPALGWALWQQRSWRALAAAALALLPLLVWELFSLLFYGVPFPNTYYAKLSTGLPKGEYLAQGFVYLLDVATRDPGTALLLGCGVAAPFAALQPAARRPLAVGIALYLAYVVNAGGDFMQGRFVSVPAFLAAILLTADVDDPRRLGGPVTVTTVVLVLLLSASRLVAIEPADVPIRANGVADERRFYFAQTALVHHTRQRHVPMNHAWAMTGSRMRGTPSQPLQVFSAIGFAGYAAGPAVHIVDQHALSDPFLARLPANRDWRPGHFKRELPAGYLDSLTSGRNLLVDPQQRALYDDLRLVTRGPLLAPGRLAAIWRLNTARSLAAESPAGR